MKIVGGIIIVIILLTVSLLLINHNTHTTSLKSPKQTSSLTVKLNTDTPITTEIASGLEVPWAIAFLPDQSMLVTERPGRVIYISKDGTMDTNPVITINSVKKIGEGGLLGITLHPQFSQNHFVYLYYTYSSTGSNTLNRVVRMKYENKTLANEQVIIDKIPGSSNHDGGRIKFGPDNYLYITTGDAEQPSQAQNINYLGGKILRSTDDGKPASGNPFNNLVFSYGHRNPQGIDWNSKKELWETEHGRSGALTGYDELNLIQSGKNYGWPDIQGDETRQNMITPRLNSGPTTTWAPAGAAFINDILFFGGLRGQALYTAEIKGDQINLTEYFKNKYGRIREVIKGPDGFVYITTSNRDGRGNPAAGDDKIIRVNTSKL